MTATLVAAPGEDALPQMADRDFARVAERIAGLAGITLEAHKRQMIRARLARRLRETGMRDFGSYLDALESGRDPRETQEFVNALTTNLTSLFREAHHFRHFTASVVEPWQRSGGGRLRVWSAGCSSGEEPYSIALAILAAAGGIPADARILATDIDTRMLRIAEAGIYPPARCADLDTRLARLLEDGPDGRRMPAEARRAIAFRRLNLLEPWPFRGPFDAVFCRNVMIYFGAETKAALLDRFATMVRPGGFLYLGHSESILGGHRAFAACGETVYRRVEAA